MIILDIAKIFEKASYYLVLSIISALYTNCPIDAEAYPIHVKIIQKNQAQYNTPENAYISLISAMRNSDIDWYYNSLTEETKHDEIQSYQKYHFDINKKFKSIENIEQIIILHRKKYRDGIALIVKTINNDGSVLTGPSVFILENGLWKSQSAIDADDPILDYLEYSPPPENLLLFDLFIFPQKWNISRYNQLSSRGHGKVSYSNSLKKSILCVLSPQENKDSSVTDIMPETLRLNYTVSPVPWYSSMHKLAVNEEKKYAHVIFSHKDYPWPDGTEFVERWEKFSSKNSHGKPVMLVRFDMFEAMQTMLQLDAGREYNVSITGKLKDGREFKATADIILVGSQKAVKYSRREKRYKHHVVHFH